MSWSLGDDCSGDGYSNDQTSKQKCELTPGLYTLKCMDSEGDGWLEGASITVEWDSVDEVYCDDWDCDGLSVCGDKYEEASFEIAIGGKNLTRDIFLLHFILSLSLDTF